MNEVDRASADVVTTGEWPRVPLGEVCKQDRGIIEPGSPEAGGLPYLSLEHVESQTGRILKQTDTSVEDEGKSTTFRFDKRHVLYGKLRPYLNKVALPDFAGRCTTEMIPLLPAAGVDRQFLACLLRREETIAWALRQNNGSRMPRADMDSLLTLSIPLPPLAEQERIAGRLTEQLAAVERARGAAQSRLAAAESLPAAYLREVFEGPQASGWERPTIDDIAEVQGGYAFRSDWFTEGGVRILRNANIHQGFIEWDDVVFVSADRARELPSLVLAEGDIVLTLDRPIVAGGLKAARLGAADLPAVLNQRVARFNLDANRIDAGYFYTFLRSEAFIGGLPKHDHSLGVPHVSPGQVGDIAVPLPPLPDQRRIAADLAARLAGTERLAEGIRAELAAIEALPAALLREAFAQSQSFSAFGHGPELYRSAVNVH